MTYRNKAWRRFCAGGLFSSVCLFCIPSVLGQNVLEGGSGLTPEQEQELDYADRLLAAGLPDYSRRVLEKLNLPPEIMDIRRVQAFVAQGKFKEAEELVASLPGDSQGAWTLKISLADGYYAWGRYEKAKALYESFFKRFPSGPQEALKPFYLSSAYKYAQMMILLNDQKSAAEAYRMALRSKPERHISRQLMSELTEVLIRRAETARGDEQKTILEEIQKLVDEILWVQDVWFGRAIVTLAHMRMMTGNIDGAMSLIDDYGEELRGIDRALREQSEELGEDLTKLSPMAQCRYMIGVIMHDEAMRMLEAGGDKGKALELLIGQSGTKRNSGALQHFLNVFIRYPNTSWAPDAGVRFRQVEEVLKRVWDRQVRVTISPEQWVEVEMAQFRESRALFNQQRFEEAAASYEQVLALFPERETAVQALGELAACYIELGHFTLADTVVRHAGERFNRNASLMNAAGDQVLRVAFKYAEHNEPDKQRETFGVFFEYFKDHPRAVIELFRFAEDAYRANDFDQALAYYNRIVEDHEGKAVYLDALNRIPMIYSQQGKVQEEIRALNDLIKKLEEAGRKDHLMLSAMYRQATALRELGPRAIDMAVAKFKEIEDLLKDPAKRVAFQASPDEQKANLQILQGAMLSGAVSDAMRTTVPPPVQETFDRRAGRPVPPETILNRFYKDGAVRRLIELVDMFPESSFAPSALSQAGTLNTVIGKADDARLVLQRLQREYPDSPQAANAVFMIGRNLLEMGMRREAVAYFKQMFAGGGEYSNNQILMAGRELFSAGEYDMAIEAFDQIIKSEKERGILEPARVGKAQALVRQQRYQEALPVLEKLLEDYPSSGYTIEICRSASAAYAAVASETVDENLRFDLFNKGVNAMNRARRFAQDDGIRTELDVGVARIFERKAAAEERFGTPGKAQEYLNDAVAAYQTVMMFRDANNPAVAPHLQDAYAYCLPLMLRMERWDDVLEDAQKYLSTFPNGKHVMVVRNALTRARVGGGTARAEDEVIVDDDEPLL